MEIWLKMLFIDINIE